MGVLGVRQSSGGISVSGRNRAGAPAGYLVPGRHRRYERVDGAADLDHHLRGHVRLVDRQRAQPGVLRVAPHPGHGRVRRLRLTRPLRVLPVLRDRRTPDVPVDRDLGIVRTRPAARRVRLGDGVDGRRHQRVRRDEAHAVPAPRVGVHPGRHPGLVRRRRVAVILVPHAPDRELRSRPPVLGLPRVLRRLRRAGRHLAAPHVVARWPRGGADSGVDAARRRADEARRLRRGAPGDGAAAGGSRRLGVARRNDCVHQHRLRRAERDGPDRPQVRDRVLPRCRTWAS